MADEEKAMLCIGPADHVLRECRGVLMLIEHALKTVESGDAKKMRALTYELSGAARMLKPILAAMEGKSPPPPVQRPKLTKAQRAASQALARAMIAAAHEHTEGSEEETEAVH